VVVLDPRHPVAAVGAVVAARRCAASPVAVVFDGSISDSLQSFIQTDRNSKSTGEKELPFAALSFLNT
jgi:hypothetical protein